MGRPSLEVKVTDTVWLAPAVTEIVPGTEGVATTVSFVPVVPPPGPLKPAGPVAPPVEVPPVEVELEAVYTPVLSPESVELQPDKYASEKRDTSSAR